MTPPLLYCEQLPRFTAVIVVTRCVGYTLKTSYPRCVGFIQRLGHWLAGRLGPGGFMRQGGGCCTHRVRTALSTPVAKDISRRRGRVSQPGLSPVKFAVGALRRAGLDLETGGRLDRLHTRVHLRWVSRWTRRLFVVTGARCPLTKPVVTAVEQQATTEPHCSPGVQPGDIYVHVVQRGRAESRRSGVGLAPRQQALAVQLFSRFASFTKSRIENILAKIR
jgi:hypothetical protein